MRLTRLQAKEAKAFSSGARTTTTTSEFVIQVLAVMYSRPSLRTPLLLTHARTSAFPSRMVGIGGTVANGFWSTKLGMRNMADINIPQHSRILAQRSMMVL